MAEITLELLYDRFAREGDVGALAQVFDRVAPDLGRLALQLVGDRSSADDLVQETFLFAVEQPQTFDSTRKLTPWLVGVLVNRARNARWRQARKLDATRLPDREVPTPEALATLAEHQAAVTDAVADLPAELREVVEARLAGVKTDELADRLGVARGTMRVRLHRGLQRLRRVLPPGLATAFAVTFIHSKGHAMVRARVLETAQKHPLAKVATTGASALGLGSYLAMKKALAATLVAVLGLAGLQWSGVLSNGPDGEGKLATELAKTPPVLVATSEDEGARAEDWVVGEAAQSRTEVEVLKAPKPEPKAELILKGRVVDENGEPLVGAKVELSAYKEWAEGSSAKPISEGSNSVGWTKQTDVEGAFLFAVHVPSASKPRLTVTPDEFHEAFMQVFHSDGSKGSPLISGVRDLGVIRLGPAGVIRGALYGPSGEPIVGERVTLSSILTPAARSGIDGTWSLHHVPPGLHGIRANPEGYITRKVQGIKVDRGIAGPPIEIHFERAGSISGRIVDTEGVPVEGAHIEAFPVELSPNLSYWRPGNSSSSGSFSQADGTFKFGLSWAGTHSLFIDKEGYYSRDTMNKEARNQSYAPPLDPCLDDPEVFEPDTAALTFSLKPIEELTFLKSEAKTTVAFRVIDYETGEPITNFSLVTAPGVLEDGWDQVPKELRGHFLFHEDGEVELPAKVGSDLLWLESPGYLERYATVEVANPRGTEGLVGEMEITMLPMPRFSGRVVEGGQAVPGATVQFIPSRTGIWHEGSRDSFQLSQEEPLICKTGADGRFSIESPFRLRFGLRVEVPSGARYSRDDVRSAKHGNTNGGGGDLGDIHVAPPASIEGMVLMPATVEAGGIQVYLDSSYSALKNLVGDDGAFKLEGIASGSHVLYSGAVNGRLEGGGGIPIELAPGEHKSIVLDLRGLELLPVEFTLTLNGKPISSASVMLHPVHRGGRASGAEMPEWIRLADGDEDGRCSGLVREFGEIWLKMSAVTEWGYVSLIYPHRLQVLKGERNQFAVNFEADQLSVIVPQGVESPEGATLKGSLFPIQSPAVSSGEDSSAIKHLLAIPLRLIEIEGDSGPPAFEAKCVAPGTYTFEWDFEIKEVVLDAAWPGGSKRATRTLAKGKQQITIEPGGSVIQLAE